MKNMKIKFLALIIGIACFACSSEQSDEKHGKGEHRTHHGKEHGHHGGKKGRFEKGKRFHSMNPDSMAKHRTEMMKEELALTNEQLPKVEQLNLKYANKMKAIREQMKQLEEERKKELLGILTNEQIEKLELKRRHHRGFSGDSVQDDN